MLALYGGTFNPVHAGHIALAREVRESFDLQRIEFLPSYIPVHRDRPDVSADIRKRILEIAIQPYAELSLNSLELDRQGDSFAIDTLLSISARFPQHSLCWLMGTDSFNSFLSWKDPHKILQLANLIVCNRPGIKLDKSIFPEHQLPAKEPLKKHKSGKIVFYPMQPNHCSSTQIRAQLKRGESVSRCLSQPVLEFIRQHHLYTN